MLSVRQTIAPYAWEFLLRRPPRDRDGPQHLALSARVASDPAGTVRAFAAGERDEAQLEALAAVYPKLFEALMSSVDAALRVDVAAWKAGVRG